MGFAAFVRALAYRRQGRPIALRSGALAVIRRTGSTHLLARRIVGEYSREGLAPAPVDLVAWEQTGGIGRSGGGWSSPPGRGVYLTSIRALASEERIQTLPLAIGAAVCESLDRRLGGGRCRLKWPNDLQVGERKLGGILIDVLSPAAREDADRRRADRRGAVRSSGAGSRPGTTAVLSLGVNVRRDLEAFGVSRATSLEAELERAGAAGAELALDAVVAELVDAVDAELAREAAPESLVDRYQRLSIHRPGDEMRCRAGDRLLAGVFRGFDLHGFLRLEVGGEELLVSSGVVESG